MTDHRNGRQVTNQQDEKFKKDSHGRNAGTDNPSQKLGETANESQKFSQSASDFTLAEQAEKAHDTKPLSKEEKIDFGSAQLKDRKNKP